MTPTEAIPLLLVVLLLISAGGGDADSMTITFEGDRAVESIGGVHVVAGGTTTVPADADVTGDLYVIGGTTTIAGSLDGDATVLAGNLTVADSGTITGTLQRIAGETTIADGATVGRLSSVEPPAPANSPARRVGGFLVQFVLLGAAGWWLATRRPGLLDTVGDAITRHTLVSGVVGALAAATLLVLFVYMAFTLLLIPLSVVGLLAEGLVVLYGQIVFGYLVGRRLPIERVGPATALGVGLFLLGIEALGVVPLVGGIVQLTLLAVGFGAVLNTYFGLQRFEPVTIPGGE
jgi:hypothetical protein